MKKLSIALLICVISVGITHAQTQSDDLKLPKKSVKKLIKFSKKNKDWNVAYGECACKKHGGETLSDGEIVVFCWKGKIEGKKVRQHYFYKVQGRFLVFDLFHEVDKRGKTLRKCRSWKCLKDTRFSDVIVNIESCLQQKL